MAEHTRITTEERNTVVRLLPLPIAVVALTPAQHTWATRQFEGHAVQYITFSATPMEAEEERATQPVSGERMSYAHLVDVETLPCIQAGGVPVSNVMTGAVTHLLMTMCVDNDRQIHCECALALDERWDAEVRRDQDQLGRFVKGVVCPFFNACILAWERLPVPSDEAREIIESERSDEHMLPLPVP